MGAERQAGLEGLAAVHGGLFTIAQAVQAGWGQGSVRSAASAGEIFRLRHGVYTSAQHWSRADSKRQQRLVLMAHQRVDPKLVGFGISAAAALGLPLPADPLGPDFGINKPSLRRLRPGERVLSIRNGPLLTTPDRIVIDCACFLPIEWGLAVADAAVAGGLIGLGDLQPADKILPVEGPNGPRGIRQARWVLDHVQDKVESPLESLARAVIILGGFEEPKPQQWIKTRLGRYRVDLVDEKARVITEADGKVKYEDKGKSGKDNPLWREKTREDALRDQDYEVVRFTMADYYARTSFWGRYTDAIRRASRFPR